MQVRKCELMSSGIAADLHKLKREPDTLSRTKDYKWKQQGTNFLPILKCKYDLSFQSRPPAAFIWLSWHSNLWHGDELQLPVLLPALTALYNAVTYRPTHLPPCSQHLIETTAQSAFAVDISRKNKHIHNMNSVYNLATVSTKFASAQWSFIVMHSPKCHGFIQSFP